MNTIPDCQDWTPVVFNKKKNANSSSTQPTSIQTPSSSLANVGIYKAASDDDVKKTKYVSKTTSDAVRNARCGKSLTQKELAQKCNMDVAIIAELERGGGPYNPGHVNKIQSILGVKIPR
jgi:ribosome-binding protein aMBF1 (putative translation factor)